MEKIEFPSNLILDIDPGEFLSGDAAYEFPLYSPVQRTKEIENTIVVGGETTNQTVRVTTNSYTINSLRAYINIISLPPVPPVTPGATDDDYTFSVKSNENDLAFPGIALDLIMKLGDLRVITGQFRLQNKRPGYFINILKFLTSEPVFNAGLNTSLIVRFRDLGSGLLRMDDHVYFYGDVTENGYFAPIQSTQSQGEISLSGSIGAVLSGALTTSGGGTNPPPIVPGLKATLTHTNFQGEFLLYFLPNANSAPTADLSNGWSWSLSTASGEVQDLTQYVTTMGTGYYFFAASTPLTNEAFDTALSLQSQTIEPGDRASIQIGQAIDPSRGHTTAVALYAVHITNTEVSINLQFTI